MDATQWEPHAADAADAADASDRAARSKRGVAAAAAVGVVAVVFVWLGVWWVEASGAERYARVLPIAHESAVPFLAWYVAARLVGCAAGLVVLLACLALVLRGLGTRRQAARAVE